MDTWKTFAEEHFKTPADVNLKRVRSLLVEQRAEQLEIEKKLQATTSEAKAVLSDVLDNAQVQLTEVKTLRASLAQAQNDLSVYCTSHDIHLEQQSPKKQHMDDESPQAALLKDLTAIEEKINNVESAKGYIKALFVASKLSSQALSHAEADPEAAVKFYTQLKKLVQYVEDQPAAHGFNGLIAYLESSQSQAWESLTTIFTKHFQSALEELEWPKVQKLPIKTSMRPKIDAFKKTFRHLLLLLDLSERPTLVDGNACKNSTLSAALTLLMKPLTLRFRFHFEKKNKETNRIDKPEWFLDDAKRTISNHILFLASILQPEVNSVYAGMDGERPLIKNEFIRGMLANVSRKLRKSLPILLAQNNLLNRTVHAALQFDKQLQDEFAYNTESHGGAAIVILENPEMFQAWLENQRSAAQKRYYDIVSSSPFEPYKGEDASGATEFDKGTTSAVRLQHLLEAITTTFCLLPRFQQKLAYYNGIIIELLKLYQMEIELRTDELEGQCSIRAISLPGSYSEGMNEHSVSSSALPKLFGWWSSANKIHSALRKWSEDDHFVDMHYALKGNDLDDDDIPFSSPLSQFTTLCDRLKDLSAKIVSKEWAANARPYAKMETWAQTSQSANSSAMSDEIYLPLRYFRRACKDMYTRLPPNEFEDFFRRTSREIENWFLQFVIAGNRFSESGALRLKLDLESGLWKTAEEWVSRPKNYTKRLKYTLTVLTLPSEPDGQSTLSWKDLLATLSDSDPRKANVALEQLGIELLTHNEIRDILRKRIGN